MGFNRKYFCSFRCVFCKGRTFFVLLRVIKKMVSPQVSRNGLHASFSFLLHRSGGLLSISRFHCTWGKLSGNVAASDHVQGMLCSELGQKTLQEGEKKILKLKSLELSV